MSGSCRKMALWQGEVQSRPPGSRAGEGVCAGRRASGGLREKGVQVAVHDGITPPAWRGAGRWFWV